MKSEGDIQRVEYRGDSLRYQAGLPVVQAAIVGGSIALGLSAIIVAALYADAIGVWFVPFVAGIEVACGLAAWRGWQDIRAPYRVERETGEDVNRDGYVGDPRIRTDNATMDRKARQVIRLAHSGGSISRAALVPKFLTVGEWDLLRKRLAGRGVVELDRKGAMQMRHTTYAESWAQYTNGPRSTSFLVNEDGDMVEAE